MTIQGRGFGSRNVRVAVNGIPADVLTASGHQVTFVVPPGVVPGSATVTATNPGGHSATIGFQVLGSGLLLPGSPDDLAADALFVAVPRQPNSGDRHSPVR